MNDDVNDQFAPQEETEGSAKAAERDPLRLYLEYVQHKEHISDEQTAAIFNRIEQAEEALRSQLHPIGVVAGYYREAADEQVRHLDSHGKDSSGIRELIAKISSMHDELQQAYKRLSEAPCAAEETAFAEGLARLDALYRELPFRWVMKECFIDRLDEISHRADAAPQELEEQLWMPLSEFRESCRLVKQHLHEIHAARKEATACRYDLAVAIAKKYVGLGIEFLDLIQEGIKGLEVAVERFNPSCGYKFSTYATWWIRKAIRLAFEKRVGSIELSPSAVEKINAVKCVQEQLRQESGHAPTPAEIAAACDLSEEKVCQALLLADLPISARKPAAQTLQHKEHISAEPTAAIFNRIEQAEEALRSQLHPIGVVAGYYREAADEQVRHLDSHGKDSSGIRELIAKISSMHDELQQAYKRLSEAPCAAEETAFAEGLARLDALYRELPFRWVMKECFIDRLDEISHRADAAPQELEEQLWMPLSEFRESCRLVKQHLHEIHAARKEATACRYDLAVAIAKKYVGLGIEFLDLIQEGIKGLEVAVERFNPSCGYKFSTYATWWIRKAIRLAFEKRVGSIELSPSAVEKINAVKCVQEQLRQESGHAPTPAEIAAACDLSEEKVCQALLLADLPISARKPAAQTDAE